MRRYILLFLVMTAVSFTLAVALGNYSQAADEATRIEVDQKANAVRIIVDDQEVATITGDGLHVNGAIAYTGTIKDAQ